LIDLILFIKSYNKIISMEQRNKSFSLRLASPYVGAFRVSKGAKYHFHKFVDSQKQNAIFHNAMPGPLRPVPISTNHRSTTCTTPVRSFHSENNPNSSWLKTKSSAKLKLQALTNTSQQKIAQQLRSPFHKEIDLDLISKKTHQP
jgi:hypothetical protein